MPARTRTMHPLAVVIALVALTGAGPRRIPAANDVVAYAKKMFASDLEETLPWVPLDDWLHAAMPAGTVFAWTRSGCDSVPEHRPGGDPFCAQLVARMPNRAYLKLNVELGNTKQGIAGSPHIVVSFVHCIGAEKEFHDVHVLSDVAAASKALAAASCG